MLFSRLPWKSLEIGLFTAPGKKGGRHDNVTPACLAWDAHVPQATYAWPQILCTWYNVSFSFTPSFYVSRMLRRPLSIKKAYWRPYRHKVKGLKDVFSLGSPCRNGKFKLLHLWSSWILILKNLPDFRSTCALRIHILWMWIRICHCFYFYFCGGTLGGVGGSEVLAQVDSGIWDWGWAFLLPNYVEPGPAFFRTMQQEKKIKNKIRTAEKKLIFCS